ncbi:uncharacterized protein LOC103175077 [Callorhinchus milii]|uniref:uncharacterized protein LOC103175077 n=1 Tax=Callorhinchus milii TaxID=7868 RepID=UPI0004575931|nr:uncharacterized protein LOC103175077 [Callorhinchus milii]|eukprot:gi/632941746/ref/XP_007886031.1/ PREDICTED: uncharacterized protein LOC103175077 [Callorhinchus milii]
MVPKLSGSSALLMTAQAAWHIGKIWKSRLVTGVSLPDNTLKLLDFKDQLLSHPLPSSVLCHLIITTGHILRSASDVTAPATQLVSLVRVYAAPWGHKEEALRLLHVNYSRVKGQLNGAIRRLQLLHGQSVRVARERRILNWERLMRKLMAVRGFGIHCMFPVRCPMREAAQCGQWERMGEWLQPEALMESREDFLQDVFNRADEQLDMETRGDDEDDGDEDDGAEEEEDGDLGECATASHKVKECGCGVEANMCDGATQTDRHSKEQSTWTGDLQHSSRDSRFEMSMASVWGEVAEQEGELPPSQVWARMQVLEENMLRSKQCVIARLRAETSRELEKRLSGQRRLHLPAPPGTAPATTQHGEICFPALFMPLKGGQVFTPKAHLYFHPSGSPGLYRLTQPPSVLSLPSLSTATRLSVLNLLNPRSTLPVTATTQGGAGSREEQTITRRSPPPPDMEPA